MTNIRGDQIRDGTITDADVAANAGISASKLDSSLATQTYVTTAIANAGVSAPTGAILMWPTSTAPTGWRLCDGGTVDRTSALGQVIGTTYGTGNGSSTCNVPDLRGRVAVGADAMGGSAAGRISTASGLDKATLGGVGGAQTVTLTSAQSGLPNHNHLLSGGGKVFGNAGSIYTVSAGGSAGFSDITYSGAVDAQLPHTNLQPSIIINFIIKL